MRRCDTQQLTEESIMALIRQRGNLRFSTLMVFFHISSVEAIAIVEKYQKKGILDAKGKYVSERESGADVTEKEESSDGDQSEDAEIAVPDKSKVSEKTNDQKKEEKIPAEKRKNTTLRTERKSMKTVPPKQKEKQKKKMKAKKLIQRDFRKPAALDVEGQISLFDYMQFGG